MKKLILILFLVPIFLNAQITRDKYYHAGAGFVISQGSFSFINYKTNDYKLAFRASLMLNTCAAFGKEMCDSFQKRDFSYQDFTFTLVSGFATSLVNRQLQKREHRKKEIDYIEFNFNPPLVEAKK